MDDITYEAEGTVPSASLCRGSSQEVAEKLKAEIQARVEMAGLEILEARITHLAYAPEIAAAMVSNLLVVLCGNKDAQPIVNSGSIY